MQRFFTLIYMLLDPLNVKFELAQKISRFISLTLVKNVLSINLRNLIKYLYIILKTMQFSQIGFLKALSKYFHFSS